ncbi:DUF1857 domain-containing protein [Phanerochaete sordida]|uniref:DUF1857 domain-containing protein n=1 Tax=Phanerochaete sordida TaxID=48140 RepID=A0A9P3G7K8_9APHY|nr:DUF1857 domain-containing protein [Phanerochaete sordida]
MARIHTAFTAPINPADAPLKVTRAQVWEALKIKARAPTRFVPVIEHCEVVEEHAGGLTRVVQFKPGTGPPGKVTEVITFGDDVHAEFQMIDVGTVISNIVSDGEGESDLYLTFNFAWNFPDIHPGSAEETTKRAQLKEGAKGAVLQSLKEIRDLVQKGEVKA